MAETYTITSYPNFGYMVTDDGDIVRPDGTPYEGAVTDEHLVIARKRKREPKTIRVTCRSPRQPKD